MGSAVALSQENWANRAVYVSENTVRKESESAQDWWQDPLGEVISGSRHSHILKAKSHCISSAALSKHT